MAAPWARMVTVYRRYGLKLYRLHSARFSRRLSVSAVGFSHGVDGEHKRNDLVRQQITTSNVAKKECSQPMANVYNPEEVEAGWYDWWLQQGLFTPPENVDGSHSESPVFSLLLPPPNVTGNLHLGHALTGAVQDAIVRWRRMKGDRTLWIPGTDHAGIATHVVVEKQLWREHGKTRHDVGREAFVNKIWKWKQEHGDRISEQMRRLGLSLDWSREYFTMDSGLSQAVTEAFCRLYDRGLIYRDKRMINWSCSLRSSLSDIEVNSLTLETRTALKLPGLTEKVEFGLLSQFAYPVFNSDERIVVATTRLETMLADVAVAVNPDDPRYSHLIGQKVVHPLDKDRLLPIIADSFVDMTFGTGAVKITPGHDRVDYEVSCRHGLPVLEILNDDGTIASQVELVGGLNRFQARKKLKEVLSLLGLYCGETDHQTVLPLCSRTGDVVEHRLKEQWFLDCSEMSKKAVEVVESGRLEIIPRYNEKIWKDFLAHTQSSDWCLSRQLWWGHRIPVYTCMDSGRTVCARSEAEAKEKLARDLGLKSVQVVQDEDVLDTWFSSSLLPFSSLGWPTSTSETGSVASDSEAYKNFYFPQSLLETGQDILFFWVARMVMLSQELTGQVPFKKVLLHGMIRDAQGRKMSKSLGNVIDPLDLVHGASLHDLNSSLKTGNLDPSELALAQATQRKLFPKGMPRCGADALRLALCSYNVQNVDVNFDIMHVENKLRFCNKIWQSFRFIFSKLEPGVAALGKFQLSGVEDGTDRWILSRLSHLVRSSDAHLQAYNLHLAAGHIQQFWHHELCDVYLEAIKPVFLSQGEARQEVVKHVLAFCAQTFLHMLAPFMPFLSEELFQRLNTCYTSHTVSWPESVCVASYPDPAEFPWHDDEVESNMAQILSIARHIQQLKLDYNLSGSKTELFLATNSNQVLEAVSSHQTCLLVLSRSCGVSTMKPSDDPPSGCLSVSVSPDVRIFLKLQDGTIDMKKQIEGLHKKIGKLEADRDELSIKLETLESRGKGNHPSALKVKDKLTTIDGDLKKLSDAVNSLTSATGTSVRS